MAAGLATSIALLGAWAGPAIAAPTWLPPTPLSAPPRADPSGSIRGAGSPDVAFDGAGNAVAAWQQVGADGTPILRVAARAAGGAFTPAGEIGPMFPSLGGFIDPPALELDAGGTATLAFTRNDERVVVATRLPGGAFSVPVEISTGTGNHNVDLAVSPAGHAIVAWVDGADHVQARLRAPGGDFAPAVDLGPARDVFLTPQVAINDQGAAVIAWLAPTAGVDTVRARVRTAGRTLADAPEQVLSNPARPATAPDVAIDPAGRATVVWEQFDGAGNDIVQSKQANVAGQFPAVADDVSSSGASGNLPQVAVDAENTAVAVWNTNGTVMTASRASNAGFGEPRAVSAPGTNVATPPRLAVDRSGATLATWSTSPPNAALQAARRPPGGTFGGVDDLPIGAVTDVGPAVPAFDDEGNALVLWSGANASNERTIYASALDAAPPTFATVSVPSGATAAQPVGMAATATDRWTPVSISWSFGDGGTAAGGAVTHLYGQAGAFNVTVTASDAVGNATSATRPIAVAPVPATPPGATPPAATPRVRSRVRATWGVSGRRLFLLRLQVVQAPRGGRVELRCTGAKCPFKRKRSAKRRRGTITLFGEIGASRVAGKRQRAFRAGQRLDVRITAPGRIGKVVRYRLKRGRIPSGQTLCLPLGAKQPRTRCP